MDTQTYHGTSAGIVQDITIDDDIVHGICTDSGYSSHGSLTVISPDLSSLRPLGSHLQPIYENIELGSFQSTPEITPTTRNIQRINAFHITTPNSSLKRSAPIQLTTPTKNVSPKKRRLDMIERSKSYRNMIDNIHADDENSENFDYVSGEFSPIKSMGNVLQERNGKFDRKGSFSSTPINEEVSIKSKSVSKTDFFNPSKHRVFRKTQSFSPSKTLKVRHTNTGVTVSTNTRSFSVCNVQKTDNPARKLIDFSPRKFQILMKGGDNSSTVPSNRTCGDRSTFTRNIKRCEKKSTDVSRFKKFIRQNATEELSSPVNSNAIFIDDIVNEPSTSTVVNNNFSITKTNDLISDSEALTDTPIRKKAPSPFKSIKNIRRNLSFNVSQHSPKKEVDKIVFSKIPQSPSKRQIPVTKRRTSTTKTSPAAKRPLFDLLPKRKSYAQIKHFDIISNLAETTTAIEKIFGHLNPKDIKEMYNVSRTWRAIVKNDATANSRRIKYLNTVCNDKENLKRNKLVKTVSLDAVRKSPLKRANAINLRKHRSLATDSVSCTLDNLLTDDMRNQRRIKCPYCLSPSIISTYSTNQPQVDIDNENRIPFQRNCHDYFQLSDEAPKPNENPNEIAECIKKSCGFKFCVKCLCAYHNDAKCPIEPYSPTEDLIDRKLLYPTGARSKRNLRRLCSLDKC